LKRIPYSSSVGLEAYVGGDMIRLSLIIVFFIPFVLVGQEKYRICPLFDLNSSKNETSCGIVQNELVVQISELDNKSQFDKRKGSAKHKMRSWIHGDSYSEWNSLRCIIPGWWDCAGSVAYSPLDELVYFSSTKNFDGSNGKGLKLYSSQWNGSRWEAPEVLPMVDFSSDFTHPHYVPSLRMLVFSSNRSGGQGGMDIWYCMQTEQGWSEPMNLGLGVNSSGHEIFPTFHEGDIYFATNAMDTWGGYDIRRASGKTQWKTAIAEGAPMNSAADDVCVLFLSNDKAILTSNRAGGRGGDDLFLLSREARPEELHDMTAHIEFAGHPLAAAQLTVRNDAGEIVQIAPSDQNGNVDIRALRLNQAYTFQMAPSAQIPFSECLLVLKDSRGNRLTEVRFNLKGFAMLELLPFQFSDIHALNTTDQSVLNLSFEGQLYEEKPGDIGRGEPITILNAKGEAVALAYTNDSGKFRFTKLDPQLHYVMRLSEQTEAKHAIITQKGSKIDLPVLNAEVNYTRLAAEDAITLINEFNDTIHVSPEDLFVINRIYYDYNSAQLTNESRRQLEQLAIIMERNSEINLELRSHTDSRGDAAYNLKLSQQRAKSAIQFIVAKGLEAARFQFDGAGEAEPINECVDGIACSEPEYAINRRTEIRLKRRNGLALTSH